jgi:hypothetical protein
MEKFVKSHLISRFEKAEVTGRVSGPGTLANDRFKHQRNINQIVGGTARNLAILGQPTNADPGSLHQELSAEFCSSKQPSSYSGYLVPYLRFGALNAKG